ncbi:hypothetical protein [Chitinimonas naiadis]
MTTQLQLTRDSGYADKARDYTVLLNGQYLGAIGDGEQQVFDIPAGTHELSLKIDWCTSNSLRFSVAEGEQLGFQCGSNLRGLKLFTAIYYATLGYKRYLWLAPRAT